MHECNLLNTFSAPAALLNCNGEILFVNDEWRLYSIINDGNQAYDPIGVSYLDVCGSAIATEGNSNINDAKDAKIVLDGLCGIIDGKINGFKYQYNCSTPKSLRWFVLLANRIKNGNGEILVVHMETTHFKKQVEYMAFYDGLTSLPNRVFTYEKIKHCLAASKRNRNYSALLIRN